MRFSFSVALLALFVSGSIWEPQSWAETPAPTLQSRFAGEIHPGILSEDSIYVAPGSLYGYFNHNSSVWDAKKVTKRSTEKLAELLKRNDVPTFVASHEYTNTGDTDPSYFVRSEDVTYRLKTRGGAHAIEFPNVRRLILSGGFLEYCLCEAFRDISRGLNYKNGSPIEIDLVAEAIYTSDGIPLVKKVNLKDEDEVMTYLKGTLLNYKMDRVCALQYSNLIYERDDIKASEYTFNLRRNGEEIGKIGNGPKELVLNFVNLRKLKGTLNQSAVNENRSKHFAPTEIKTHSVNQIRSASGQ